MVQLPWFRNSSFRASVLQQLGVWSLGVGLHFSSGFTGTEPCTFGAQDCLALLRGVDFALAVCALARSG